jgi:hypothetical protein
MRLARRSSVINPHTHRGRVYRRCACRCEGKQLGAHCPELTSNAAWHLDLRRRRPASPASAPPCGAALSTARLQRRTDPRPRVRALRDLARRPADRRRLPHHLADREVPNAQADHRRRLHRLHQQGPDPRVRRHPPREAQPPARRPLHRRATHRRPRPDHDPPPCRDLVQRPRRRRPATRLQCHQVGCAGQWLLARNQPSICRDRMDIARTRVNNPATDTDRGVRNRAGLTAPLCAKRSGWAVSSGANFGRRPGSSSVAWNCSITKTRPRRGRPHRTPRGPSERVEDCQGVDSRASAGSSGRRR